MQDKDAIKYQIADALKACMKKAPLEKITVIEIVSQCPTTRQTFYRHFKDKYDLVNWYFDKILMESFEHMGEGKTIYEGLINKFTFIKKEELFFKAAFKNDTQNNLRDHDFELILDFYTERIRAKTGLGLSDALRFQLEMYCQGSVYMTTRWLMKDACESPETMARRLIDAMPQMLRDVFKELELL